MPKFRVLVIDDVLNTCTSIKEFLEEDAQKIDDKLETKVTYETNFENGMELLAERRFDAVILDVRLETNKGNDDDAGIRLLQEIKASRFIPVVFYTGLPNLVDHLEAPPIIQVVTKELGARKDRLKESLINIAASPLPKINQALTEEVAKVQREYMWEFIADHWEELNLPNGDHSLFYLVARRLVLSLSAMNLNSFINNETGKENITGSENFDETVPPERYYIMPPMGLSPQTGDIYLHEVNEIANKEEDEEWEKLSQMHKRKRYWVVLTPSCDLVHNRIKAEKVLLAKCHLFEGEEEYRNWKKDASKNNKKTLEKLLKNGNPEGRQADRNLYLPGTLDVPNLFVDFQEIISVPYKQLSDWTRLASLDSPFAEALLTGFTRFIGRLGTPDLNIPLMFSRLERLVLPPEVVKEEEE